MRLFLFGGRVTCLNMLRVGIEKAEYIARKLLSTIRSLYRSCKERSPQMEVKVFVTDSSICIKIKRHHEK